MPQMNSCLEKGGVMRASLRSLLWAGPLLRASASCPTDSKLSTALRAGSSSASPRGVRRIQRPSRSNSCPPSSSSSSCIDFETAWTVTPSARAVAEKFPARAAR